jgi:hypothetical protein
MEIVSEERSPNAEYVVPVECYRPGRTEEIGEKPVPVPQLIPHGIAQTRTQASEVRGCRLTA